MIRLLLTFIVSVSFAVHGHEGHANLNAVKACHDKDISNSCSYIMGENKLYKGTCRSISEKMMCVRNQPIEILPEPKTDLEKALPKKD